MDISILPWAGAAAGLALAARGALELRRRRELVARACHELRGPLTAVRLSLATMERRCEAPPERLAVLDRELRRACLALDDFAAARSGRRNADRAERVDVGELVEEQFHGWDPVAGAFASVLSLGAVAERSFVLGDRLRLAQAISNLIANALEHGPGRIELTARRVGAQLVRVEVIDDGPGLPRPLEEIVRRPRAGRGSRGRGLAIASQIAERHRGRLVAAPSAQGSRIGIELPLIGPRP